MGHPIKQPPAWIDRFLEWYCREELLEVIQGDLYELYQQRRKEKNEGVANLMYIWDVIRFFRWSTIRKVKTQNNTTMVTNYFKTGWRQIKSQKITSLITISGLALAIGFAITVFVFIDFFENMDQFHERKDRIYQVLNLVEGDDEIEQWSDISWAVAEQLGEPNEAIEHMTRIEFSNPNVRYQDEVFSESVWMVDPDYMQIFDFPMAQGDRYALRNKSSVLITENVARKYFGDEEAQGKMLTMKFSDQVSLDFIVQGILENLPKRASFGGEILISADNFRDVHPETIDEWEYLTDGIFIQLAENARVTDIAPQLSRLVSEQNLSSDEWQTAEYKPLILGKLSLEHMNIRQSIAGGSHPAGRRALAIIAILLLLVACFNYVNIAVSAAARRLKEIALRKVLGGYRGQLIRQFLIENFLVTLLAMVFGLILCYFILLPGFSYMLPISIPFSFSTITTAILFFAGMIALVTVLSGAYPAFYISRFQPVNIFRGREKFGASNWLSRILMVIQLMLAFTTIVACFVFNVNAYDMARKDWGYSHEDLISIPVQNSEQLNFMEARAMEMPDVESLVTSEGHIGLSNPVVLLKHKDLSINSILYKSDPDYPKVMGLRLKEGRWFNPQETQQTMIISQKVAERLNLSDPMETTLTVDSLKYRIIGIVEDFHQDIFYVEKSPVVFIPGKKSDMNFITLRTSPGSDLEVFNKLRSEWKEIAPDDPFEGIYQSEVMDSFFRENRSNQIVLGGISGIALLLACIGLYGLISFQVSRRLKEISVRKVLGASLAQIVSVVNKDYLIMLLIAMVVGMPIGYLFVNQLIVAIYPDPLPTTIWPFVLAFGITMLAMAVTLGSQIMRISTQNPAENLRTE